MDCGPSRSEAKNTGPAAAVRHGTGALPMFGIVMKVGPHTGMSLDDIVESKFKEEARLGVHYWGYSGTSCRPRRVLEFVAYVLLRQRTPPSLLLLETQSDYASEKIGRIGTFSTDQREYRGFGAPVQLQGAQYAFVACGLQRVDQELRLDTYSVMGGRNDGRPLSQHLRYRVNKAFVRHGSEPASLESSRLACLAQLAEPYVIWLGT